MSLNFAPVPQRTGLDVAERMTLLFIKDFMDRHHHAPTQKEINRALGTNSELGTQIRIRHLELLGYLERKPFTWRSYRLTPKALARRDQDLPLLDLPYQERFATVTYER